MDITQVIQSLRDEIAQLEQQQINMIADANRQIGQVQGAIAAKQQLIAKLTAATEPAVSEELDNTLGAESASKPAAAS